MFAFGIEEITPFITRLFWVVFPFNLFTSCRLRFSPVHAPFSHVYNVLLVHEILQMFGIFILFIFILENIVSRFFGAGPRMLRVFVTVHGQQAAL